MISFFNVSKVYPNGVKALQGISIQIKNGEFVFIVGPSGAGKSTMIKLIFREELPTKGQIYIGGRILSENQLDHCRFSCSTWSHDKDKFSVFDLYRYSL
ncbi:MAG TPA: ATP-binding cassette domain-containing protein, partial [Syntrophaceticus sp.]|nr:ATP-binding cassette domain-containing protein [Syntrophaceticus sp.]